MAFQPMGGMGGMNPMAAQQQPMAAGMGAGGMGMSANAGGMGMAAGGLGMSAGGMGMGAGGMSMSAGVGGMGGGMAMGMNTNQPGMQRPMGQNPFDAFGGPPVQASNQPQPGAFGTAPIHQQHH